MEFDPTSEDARRLGIREKIEHAESRLKTFGSLLSGAPHWKQAETLAAVCKEASKMIETLKEQTDRKLAILLVGPTGSGKSTLLNALAGEDHLSERGTQGATTRRLVAFCQDTEDAEPFRDALGRDRVEVVSTERSTLLEHIILIDTPDINSWKLGEHRPIVETAAKLCELLIVVLDAQNPKQRDLVGYLSDIVASYQDEGVFVVFNKCDRIKDADLRVDIIPDYTQFIRSSLGLAKAPIFFISAQNNLHNPLWPDKEKPLNTFDQFPDLIKVIFESLNKASMVVDKRISRSNGIVAYVGRKIADSVGKCLQDLSLAERKIEELREEAMAEAVKAIKETNAEMAWSADLILYRRLAQLWWGPIGWSLNIYVRLMLYGFGFVNLLSFGRPLKQMYGIISMLFRAYRTGKTLDDSTGQEVSGPLRAYRDAFRKQWTDIAKTLVNAGFDESIRRPESAGESPNGMHQLFGSTWDSTLHATIEERSQAMSGMWMQVAFNMPVAALLLLITVKVVFCFLTGDYLSADYFRHAAVAGILLWASSFLVFQYWANRRKGLQLVEDTISHLLDQHLTLESWRGDAGILEEIRSLRELYAETERAV